MLKRFRFGGQDSVTNPNPNIIRLAKITNPNPNIRDSEEKIRIRIRIRIFVTTLESTQKTGLAPLVDRGQVLGRIWDSAWSLTHVFTFLVSYGFGHEIY